jgi:hypothetical protein
LQNYITLLNAVLKMTSVAAIETQVNKHIECCKHTRRIRTNNLSKDTVIESGYQDIPIVLLHNYLEAVLI